MFQQQAAETEQNSVLNVQTGRALIEDRRKALETALQNAGKDSKLTKGSALEKAFTDYVAVLDSINTEAKANAKKNVTHSSFADVFESFDKRATEIAALDRLVRLGATKGETAETVYNKFKVEVNKLPGVYTNTTIKLLTPDEVQTGLDKNSSQAASNLIGTLRQLFAAVEIRPIESALAKKPEEPGKEAPKGPTAESINEKMSKVIGRDFKKIQEDKQPLGQIHGGFEKGIEQEIKFLQDRRQPIYEALKEAYNEVEAARSIAPYDALIKATQAVYADRTKITEKSSDKEVKDALRLLKADYEEQLSYDLKQGVFKRLGSGAGAAPDLGKVLLRDVKAPAKKESDVQESMGKQPLPAISDRQAAEAAALAAAPKEKMVEIGPVKLTQARFTELQIEAEKAAYAYLVPLQEKVGKDRAGRNIIEIEPGSKWGYSIPGTKPDQGDLRAAFDKYLSRRVSQLDPSLNKLPWWSDEKPAFMNSFQSMGAAGAPGSRIEMQLKSLAQLELRVLLYTEYTGQAVLDIKSNPGREQTSSGRTQSEFKNFFGGGFGGFGPGGFFGGVGGIPGAYFTQGMQRFGFGVR